MKNVLIACSVACLLVARISFGNGPLNGPIRLSPKTEIAELEALIAQAKGTGTTPDPAWTTRIRELVPRVKGHPGDVVYDIPSFDSNGGFAPGAVIRPVELTPLEQEIRDLEFQFSGGLGNSEPDPVLRANLKDQLNGLYAVRPQNRERNPLDQGAGACPATVVTGLPYTDTGSTVGAGYDFSPISSCTYPPFTSNDVIYSFTPTTTSRYHISLLGSSFDTYLYVNTSGPCPGTVQVGCNDDAFGGLQSFLELMLTAGQTYYIIVDGSGFGAEGSYTLSISLRCNLDCEPSDSVECWEETWGNPEQAWMDCNGGCNNITYGGDAWWQDILPSQTLCGRGFTYSYLQDLRDTDWYRFTLTEPCSLQITLHSEFNTNVAIINDGCPSLDLLFFESWGDPCSRATFITQCFQPGTYNLWIAPSWFSEIDDPQEYRVTLDLIPCSVCNDSYVAAPGSATGNTCGAGNDNSLRPSEDYTFSVNIPYETDWTFSICSEDSIWDSYIYLSSSCDSNVIAESDDDCGGVGLSVINCVHLATGNYYLTVEGYAASHCGPLVLNVADCRGSCCYGNPADPNCAFVTLPECNSLSGTWTFMEPCTIGTCFTRPSCADGAIFSQLPALPDEDWYTFWSEPGGDYLIYDDYSVPGSVGSIRFWGLMVDNANFANCNPPSGDFEIQFIDSSSNPMVQSYNVHATGTALPLFYSGPFNLIEFDAQLNPPCTLTSGYVGVTESGNLDCDFYLLTSPFGNGQVFLDYGGSPQVWPWDLPFCLGGVCEQPESLTVKWLAPDNYRLDWYLPHDGIVTIYSSTDPNAVFPAGYSVLDSWFAYQGHQTVEPYTFPEPFRTFVVTLDCSPSALQVRDQPFKQRVTK
ncbi:MAG: hypothetical protein IPK53_12300 [bacterium]|nr:hypothetical protein [bacterium]